MQTESRTVCSLELKRLRQNVDIQFIPKPFAKSAFLDPVAKKSKVKLLERMMETKKGSVHPFAISQYRPSAKAPIRQYYHGRTNQPINPMEWQDDSDDEYDQEWIHKLGERVSSSSISEILIRMFTDQFKPRIFLTMVVILSAFT
jgi:hypothetical protein